MTPQKSKKVPNLKKNKKKKYLFFFFFYLKAKSLVDEWSLSKCGRVEDGSLLPFALLAEGTQ
jgi:hypothetical protein